MHHDPLIETIEHAAYADLFAAAPTSLREELGLAPAYIDGAFVMCASACDNPLFNRAIAASPSVAQLRHIASHYADHGVSRYFIHLYADHRSPELDGALSEVGLARYRRSWVKLLRGDHPLSAREESVTVRPATHDEALAAAQIYCAAFDQPAALAPLVANTSGREGWELLVGIDGREVVAVGLSFTCDGIMYLAGAATRPSHRRRGFQGALLRERVRRALERGCRHVVSETGEEQPGDPQHSFRNMLRLGFEPVAVRDNYAPAELSWDHGHRGASAMASVLTTTPSASA